MEAQAMDVDHDDMVAIVAESKTRLKNGPCMYCGTSVDLYNFKNKQGGGWKYGHIFRANHMEDISFKRGLIDVIYAQDAVNRREACFLVHAPDQQEKVQDMMVRSGNLKHAGVLKPYVAGFNTQVSQVVYAFSVPTTTLADWLNSKLPVQSTNIPTEVQQLIRTAYLAIELIWREGSTSDDLADVSNYEMIDNNIKINPLCTRTKKADDDKMRLRESFGQMIMDNIYHIWADGELLDFIELLGNPEARETTDVLEHPVLLSAPRRELMYNKFHTHPFSSDQKNWLKAHAHLEVNWQTDADNECKGLGAILLFQKTVRQQAAAGQPGQQAAAGQPGQQAAAGQPGQQAAAGQPGQQAAAGQPGQQAAAGQPGQQAAAGQPGQQAMGFSTDWSGALHFASVTTSHYLNHYKKVMRKEKGNWRENIQGRVDSLLKRVLPRLLSRCYNAQYVVVEQNVVQEQNIVQA